MKKWAAGSWANSRRRASSPVTRPTRRANANGQGKVPPPRCGQRGTVGRHADSRLGAEAEPRRRADSRPQGRRRDERSEEHTSELQSLMRNSYAVFCLKKKK